MTKARKLLPNPTVLIFDALKDFMPGVDEHRDGTIRNALTFLVSYVEDHNIAAIGLNHCNKDREKSASGRQLGSVALNNIPRTVWFLAYDPDEDCTYMALTKNNLGTQPLGAKYILKRTKIDKYDKKRREVVRAEQEYVTLDPEPYTESAEKLLGRLNAAAQRAAKPGKLESALAYLQQKHPPGSEVPAVLAARSYIAAGFTKYMIKKARDILGIVSYPHIDNVSGQMESHVWCRPPIDEKYTITKQDETTSGRNGVKNQKPKTEHDKKSDSGETDREAA